MSDPFFRRISGLSAATSVVWWVGAFIGAPSSQVWAFESTKVLPKGVRSINLRMVDTTISEKTDRQGQGLPLGSPLSQDLTFKKIANGEDLIKGNLLRGFLLGENIDENASVGSFSADLKAKLQVTAPIMSYGVSERWTIALAVPYYRAATNVAIGFSPNQQGQAFLAALSRPENNQVAAAREAGAKINQAVSRLDDKLVENGFSALVPWEDQGLGDITLAGKFLAFQSPRLSIATTSGLVAPTGRTDDPNILTDLPFGDGQWDLFGQVAADQHLGRGWSLNEYAKYTHQFQGRKRIREILEDEKIEVPLTTTTYKLGDKWDGGLSLQWQPNFGLVAGAGINIQRKLSDRYEGVSPESRRELEKDTEQTQQTAETSLGYSTIPLYQAGQAPIPLEAKLSFLRPLASRNTPVTNLTQFDFALFF